MTSSMDLMEQLDVPALSDSSDTEEFLQELAALNDAGLLRATVESLECGRLTPLIKEELRCRIQSRRLSEGKEELFVEFPSPTPTQPRPDEVEKRDRRREQNRRAAQKFRKRKKERGDHLIEETQRLECHNTTLRSEIRQLHEERHQLAQLIQSHASVCPLTPRQSPLTIIRESPLPQPIRESPLPSLPPPPPPPPPQSASTLPMSSPVRKSPMLIQTSAINISNNNNTITNTAGVLNSTVIPGRENTRAVILLPPSGESTPISTTTGRILMASPIHMSGRPRKSPVPRANQSPAPGEKSPVPLGSPRKQNKHANSLKLNLPGPKPVKPILPKGSLAIIKSCTSPKTPLGIITSPLPFTHSPVSFVGRSIHQSPVFFAEDCFNAANRNPYPNQSPVSFTDSNSTPGHQVTQSPIFFAEKSPGLVNSCANFFQPSSASSSSSTSSLASLLRQESPSSVISNSSVSSVFIPGSGNNNNNSAVNNIHNISDQNLSAFFPSAEKSSSLTEINPTPCSTIWGMNSIEPRSINNNNTILSGGRSFENAASSVGFQNSSDNNYNGNVNNSNFLSAAENRNSTNSVLAQTPIYQTQSFPNCYRSPPTLTPTPTDFPNFPNPNDATASISQDFQDYGMCDDICSGLTREDRHQHPHPSRSQQNAFSAGIPMSASNQTNSIFSAAGDDNVLSVEDIERSVSEAAGAVDPLLDFIDIQELLELSSFHSPNSNISSSENNNDNNATSLSCNDIVNDNFCRGISNNNAVEMNASTNNYCDDSNSRGSGMRNTSNALI